MPHATLKLIPGVDQNRTPALNETAISVSQLIRFIPDKQGLGLVQKLGGWTKFFPANVGSIVRSLLAWQDTNAVSHLGLGSQPRNATITALANNIVSATNYVTLTYSGSFSFFVSDQIVVSGVTPTAYNGTYTLTSSTYDSVSQTGTVTFVAANNGAMAVAGSFYAGDGLSVITNSVRTILTPTSQQQDIAPSFTTTLGSPLVLITASGSAIYNTDFIFIATPVSVGGLVLFGLYQCIYIDGLTQFQITATDPTGTPQAASSSVVNGGAVPSYGFTTGSSVIDVTLANHGYQIGDTFSALVPTTAAGVTVFGNYQVIGVTSSSIFSIRANSQASATTSAPMNGGNCEFIYYKVPGIPPTSTGYGVGGYGVGGYGTGVAPAILPSGNPLNASDWSLDNWGQILMSCPVGGPIFQWDPTSGATQASILSGVPVANDGMFVAMPQQQIVAWGSTFNGIQDPLLIRWSDAGDYNSWIALPTNQAGSYRIPKGSRIVGCIQGPQQGLVWTDLSIWAMQYSGPPYVYQFNEIGTGCGLIGRKAATSMNGVVYWMSQSQFFRLAGSGVEPIACPVWDVIFQDLDFSNVNKIRVAANSRFGEVSWFYPTTTSNGEVAKYVKHNALLGTWDFGTLPRTAWINQSVLGAPIGAGTSGTSNFIYQHETSPDADGQPMSSSFQTGYFVLSEGEWKIFVDQVWPDMKWGYYDGAQDANVNLTFSVTDYPDETPRVYGPYALDSSVTFVTPRFRGRLVSISLGSDDIGSFWRIGAMRYRFMPDGKF